MKIRDFAAAAKSAMIIKVMQNDNMVCVFDPEFWECMSDDILNLEIDNYRIERVFLHQARIIINVSDADTVYVDDYDSMATAMADVTIRTVKLSGNINAGENPVAVLMSDGVKMLKLNGFSITGTSNLDEEKCAAIKVTGGTLMIDGNASESVVYSGTGCEANMAVWATGDGAKVMIYGGRFDGKITASDDAIINIYGGYFENAGLETGIICYGGTFLNENPANFVPEGYTVEETENGNDVFYTVKEDEEQ